MGSLHLHDSHLANHVLEHAHCYHGRYIRPSDGAKTHVLPQEQIDADGLYEEHHQKPGEGR